MLEKFFEFFGTPKIPLEFFSVAKTPLLTVKPSPKEPDFLGFFCFLIAKIQLTLPGANAFADCIEQKK